ncbi:hypothetical protein ACN99C_11675 [Pseudomonas alloputida]|uniref:Uncharacterized protein n=1 Tax=Pseudomonas putida TaxID=303 RepID=A0AAW5HKF4_PSEPU|nr:hypothetical protein [Pseudomonas putida]MCO1621322.1 hypothetical protein [Pseudomonas putida]
MATVTFTDDPVAEARALATTLALWLREQDPPEAAPPASVKFAYTEAGALKSVTVVLAEGD